MGPTAGKGDRVPAIQFNLTNLRRCICPTCPVQLGSDCIQETSESSVKLVKEENLPQPTEAAALYCASAVGKVSCMDFAVREMCQCPSCEVWIEGSLCQQYYCVKGSAEMVD